ncbi:MAG: hypothetical protein QOF60_845 [Actinomycetota bacterium]|jgi:hypothetical protein|nr:hypothetical protein [Actinomycetota bacterium]
MSPQRVVVDGSNIATEGRSLPSLVQLDEAVRAYREEHPDAEIIVVVDATFAHRIPEDERDMFEAAAAHNELVYPPAGAIGRGDAFLLRIADKTDAIVLSNDSFQEFHGEFEWLFTKGRLVGGTPVPGVGWIFVPRTPVRGPKSREAVKEAKRGKARIGSKEASVPMPTPKVPPPRTKAKEATKAEGTKAAKGKLKEAIEVATEEVVSGEPASKSGKKRRRNKRKEGAAAVAALPTVNDPLTFIQFIADYRPGATVEGEVESFASHGAFVLVGEARCYIPLSAMGDPPPRSAREVLTRGDTRPFVVQALDAPRRGIELALPGLARVAGQPTEETVEAEIEELPVKKAPAKRTRKKAAPTPAADPIPIVPEAPRVLTLKTPAAKKKKAAAPKKAAATPKKTVAPKKAVAKKAASKKTPAPKKTATKKAAAAPKKTPAAKKSAAPKKVAAKKTPAKKKAAAKKR